MPDTRETETVARSAEEVFDRVADFARLSEWDPMFDRSSRLDQGPLGPGARFAAEGSVLGKDIDLELTIVTFDRPNRVTFNGEGDGLSTVEDITIVQQEDGCQVTYYSSFETEQPKLVEALTGPAFTMAGKRTMKGLREWLEASGSSSERR
jgi:carbon monoxide dehydrogenase subunit G